MKAKPIFITGIGTGVGKTIISAIISEALQADYWKPIQSGTVEGTDSVYVQSLLTNRDSKIHPEVVKFQMPASPHIAAREEGIQISISSIVDSMPATADKYLVIEGAGGLMVPINDKQFIIDLIESLNAQVVLVSRNYLGSINHSLLTAQLCKQRGITVAGWIFNDQYLDYENEIVQWTGYLKIGSLPFCENIDRQFVKEQSAQIQASLIKALV